MATKLTNNEARVFNKLVNGANWDQLFEVEKEKINNTGYYCSDEQAQKYKDQNIEDLLNVKVFFDKIKFFDTPELYAVNGWGYGQTNYENLKVLGQIGGSMVCIIDSGYSNVYTIQKKKYTEKNSWTYIDSDRVRATSWKQPYSNDAIMEQVHYNAYNGH